MTTPPSIEGVLQHAWSRDFTGLPAWPVAPEDVPREREALLAALESAPEKALEFVRSNTEPSAHMAALELPRDRGELLDPQAGHFSVLRVGNVAAWCAPVAEWCRRWAEMAARVTVEHPVEVRDVRADLYVTAPRSITAFHADPSHNFTLQVAGRREMHAFSNRDPRLIAECTRAGIYLHRALYPVYNPACEDRAHHWQLEPGNSCYIPPLTAHWIRNGEELSVSYVISVRTSAEIREKLVHGMNERLRGLGYRPTCFGSHPGHDALKASIESTLRRTRRWIRQHVKREPSNPYLDALEV
jgi:hypothetical protein